MRDRDHECPDSIGRMANAAGDNIREVLLGLSQAAGPHKSSALITAGIPVATCLALIYGNPYGVGKTSGEATPESAFNKEAILYGCIVLGVSISINDTGKRCDCGRKPEHNAVGIGIDYGPDVLAKAADLFEAAFGEKPDKYLDPKLVEVLDEQRAAAAAPMTKFLEARKAQPPQQPLN